MGRRSVIAGSAVKGWYLNAGLPLQPVLMVIGPASVQPEFRIDLVIDALGKVLIVSA